MFFYEDFKNKNSLTLNNVLDTIFPKKAKSLELTLHFNSFNIDTVTSSEISFSEILYREVLQQQNTYLNFFFAKLGSFSNSSLIKASFLALDHFLIFFSVSIANPATVNSQ